MKKKKFSVEFSHIYTNETFSEEHRQSIKKLKKYFPKIKSNNYQTCILIDDYNSTEDLLDIDKFFKALSGENAQPDYFAFESSLIGYKEDLLSAIQDKKIRKSYERYINSKDKLPCSFMTAIWYFIRLGIFRPDKIVRMKKANKFFPAEKIINILPERFRAVEAKTLKIIASTKNPEVIGKIDYFFYSSGNSNKSSL